MHKAEQFHAQYHRQTPIIGERMQQLPIQSSLTQQTVSSLLRFLIRIIAAFACTQLSLFTPDVYWFMDNFQPIKLMMIPTATAAKTCYQPTFSMPLGIGAKTR